VEFRDLDLIATVIDFCTPPQERGRGHPRSATVRVVATLRQFLREGTPWRSLTATAGKVSGSTLRRHLEQWARIEEIYFAICFRVRLVLQNNPGVHNEVAIMADFANPTQVSEWALGLSRSDYMGAWSAYTDNPRFTYRADRLAEARALGERLADARDSLRPLEEDGRA